VAEVASAAAAAGAAAEVASAEAAVTVVAAMVAATAEGCTAACRGRATCPGRQAARSLRCGVLPRWAPRGYAPGPCRRSALSRSPACATTTPI
jgi:hypothetical protein